MKFDTIHRFKWLNNAGDYVTSHLMATLQGVEKMRGVIIGGEFDLAEIDRD